MVTKAKQMDGKGWTQIVFVDVFERQLVEGLRV